MFHIPNNKRAQKSTDLITQGLDKAQTKQNPMSYDIGYWACLCCCNGVNSR